jgi:hypothetical protein
MYDHDSFMKTVYADVSIHDFYGDVLYLGMGSLWIPRKQTDKVTSTTIIEIDSEIIKQFSHHLKPDWKLINTNAWTYEPIKSYDVIFADVWHNIIDYVEVKKMFDKYKDYLKPNGYMICLDRLVRFKTIPIGQSLKFETF